MGYLLNCSRDKTNSFLLTKCALTRRRCRSADGLVLSHLLHNARLSSLIARLKLSSPYLYKYEHCLKCFAVYRSVFRFSDVLRRTCPYQLATLLATALRRRFCTILHFTQVSKLLIRNVHIVFEL